MTFSGLSSSMRRKLIQRGTLSGIWTLKPTTILIDFWSFSVSDAAATGPAIRFRDEATGESEW